VASSEAISLGDISIRDSRGHYHPGTTFKQNLTYPSPVLGRSSSIHLDAGTGKK
jgi:hypothetical protein